MKKLQTAFLGLVAATAIFSCKKKDNPPPEPKIYLKSYARSDGAFSYTFTYDNQNRVQQVDYSEPGFSIISSGIQFDANNNIIEFVDRLSTGQVKKHNAAYDAQNRLLSLEVKDSVSPATFALRNTYSFSYSANTYTRTATNNVTGTATRIEYTYNSSGNLTESKTFNTSGVNIISRAYSGYDTKNNFETLLPLTIVYYGYMPGKNNYSTEVSTDASGATTRNAVYVYNSDNYPAQVTYSGGTAPARTVNYTYGKR